jgi:replicative DNA helicase
LDGTQDNQAIRIELERLAAAAPTWKGASNSNDAKAGYRFNPIDSTAFATGNYRPTWLVKRLLVRNQPGVIGGPRKSLKTGIILDLAISLGSGRPFLGMFDVYKPVRCAVISGESGEHTLQETFFRICHVKGIEPSSVNCLWDFRLPQLANAADLTALETGLRDNAVEVLFLDPLYLCMLGGIAGRELEASNLFETGPLLLAVTEACRNAGTTPILAHHARKNRKDPYQPMELDDLAFAGIQEFARQWMLVSRREPFEMSDEGAVHKLWLTVGGSVGHGGTWGVDIDEGVLNEFFGGRRWTVTVEKATVARREEAEAGDKKQQAREVARGKADDAKVLAAIDTADPERQGASCRKIRDLAGISPARVTRAIQRLLDDAIIENIEVAVAIGSNATRKCNGLRRKPPTNGTNGTNGTDQW